MLYTALPLAGVPNVHLGDTVIFGVVLLVCGGTTLIHIAFAWAVLLDCDLMWRTEKRKPTFASASLWALATLIGGVLVAGIYWVMHRSTLRPPST